MGASELLAEGRLRLADDSSDSAEMAGLLRRLGPSRPPMGPRPRTSPGSLLGEMGRLTSLPICGIAPSAAGDAVLAFSAIEDVPKAPAGSRLPPGPHPPMLLPGTAAPPAPLAPAVKEPAKGEAPMGGTAGT